MTHTYSINVPLLYPLLSPLRESEKGFYLVFYHGKQDKRLGFTEATFFEVL